MKWLRPEWIYLLILFLVLPFWLNFRQELLESKQKEENSRLLASLSTINEQNLREEALNLLSRRLSWFYFQNHTPLAKEWMQTLGVTIKDLKWGESLESCQKKPAWNERSIDSCLSGDGYRMEFSASFSQIMIQEIYAYFVHKFKPEQAFLLEKAPNRIDINEIALLREISALKDEYRIERQEHTFYLHKIALPLSDFSPPVLVICIPIDQSQTFWDFLIFMAVTLPFYVWIRRYRKGQRLVLSAPGRMFLFLGASAALLLLLLSMQSTAYQENYQRWLKYEAEKIVLTQSDLPDLEVLYEEIESLLPLAFEAIYTLPKASGILVFKTAPQKLQGTLLKTPSRVILPWAIFVLLLGLVFILIHQIIRSEISVFRELLENLVRLRTTEEPELDTKQLQAFYPAQAVELVKAGEALTQRDRQQKFMAREIFALLAKRADFVPHQEPCEIKVWSLVIQYSDWKNLFLLSAQDQFLFCNQMLSVIRSCADKYNAIPFFEDGPSTGILFYSAQFESVAQQRAFVCGLEILKRLEELGTFHGRISQGILAMKMGYSDLRHEILIGGPLMDEIEALNRQNTHPSGLFIASELLRPALHFLFHLETDGGSSRILGVKNIEEHLTLLNSGSKELQKTALELAGLQSDISILEHLLQSFPLLDTAVVPQAVEILKSYIQKEDRQIHQRIFQALEAWSNEPELLKTLLQLYQSLPVDLSEDDLLEFMRLPKKDIQEDVLKLVLVHYKGDFKASLHEKFLQASLPIRAEWAAYRFRNYGLVDSLEELVEYLKQAQNSDVSLVLSCFLKLKNGRLEQSRLQQNLLLWMEKRTDSLSELLLQCLQKGRQDAFLALQVVSLLQIEKLIQPLVLKYEASLDRELKAEILYTLKQLGADSFLVRFLQEKSGASLP